MNNTLNRQTKIDIQYIGNCYFYIQMLYVCVISKLSFGWYEFGATFYKNRRKKLQKFVSKNK